MFTSKIFSGQFQQSGILYRCSFDNQETCNLQQQVSGDDFDWIIGYGQLFRPRGPAADHSASNARGKDSNTVVYISNCNSKRELTIEGKKDIKYQHCLTVSF